MAAGVVRRGVKKGFVLASITISVGRETRHKGGPQALLLDKHYFAESHFELHGHDKAERIPS